MILRGFEEGCLSMKKGRNPSTPTLHHLWSSRRPGTMVNVRRRRFMSVYSTRHIDVICDVFNLLQIINVISTSVILNDIYHVTQNGGVRMTVGRYVQLTIRAATL
jgi:hypothetical protein